MKIARALLGMGLFLFAMNPSGSPAGAAVDASVEFLHGTDGDQDVRSWTPRAGSVLRGSWLVIAEARASSSLKSFGVAIEATQDGHTIEPGGAVLRTYAAGTTSVARIEIEWDTSKLTRFNGNYRLVATAVSQIDEATTSVQRLKVDNTPQTPTGLVAKNSSGVPTLSWRANPEPDILFYRVLRSVEGEPYSVLAEAKGVTFEDRQAPEGAELRYKVLAVRASPVTAAGIASASTSPTLTLFIVPASVAGNSQLDEARAPEPQVQASAPTFVGSRRDIGYSPYLPFDERTLERKQSGRQQPPLIGAPEILRGVTEGTAYKPKYTAGGLILLVAALHMLRLAQQLFLSPGSTTSPPILVSK